MRPTIATISPYGLRLAVREWTGPARGAPGILLLHGLGSSARIFDDVGPRLARGFRVVAYDQRGHGESGKPASGYGFDHVAADVLAVMDSLRLRRPVVVGHSWGANVALEAAARHPRRVAGAVLIDGGFISMRARFDWPAARERLRPPELGPMTVDGFVQMVRGFLEPAVPFTDTVEAVLRSIVRVGPDGLVHPRLSMRNHMKILRSIWEQDTEGLLRTLRVPTLVIAARDAGPDEGSWLEAKRRAARSIRAMDGPVRFAWMRGVHDLPIQRAGAVAGRIRDFAREVHGPGP